MATEERKMILTAMMYPFLPQMLMKLTTRIGVILGVSTAGLLHLVFLAEAAEVPDLETKFLKPNEYGKLFL